MATHTYTRIQHKTIELTEADEVVLDMAKITGKFVYFIKYIRYQYGYGLVEAKQIWDALK